VLLKSKLFLVKPLLVVAPIQFFLGDIHFFVGESQFAGDTPHCSLGARGPCSSGEFLMGKWEKKMMFITKSMSFMDIYSGIHFSDMDFESRNDFDNEILCYHFKT
jgi:hypothetical protein